MYIYLLTLINFLLLLNFKYNFKRKWAKNIMRIMITILRGAKTCRCKHSIKIDRVYKTIKFNSFYLFQFIYIVQ